MAPNTTRTRDSVCLMLLDCGHSRNIIPNVRDPSGQERQYTAEVRKSLLKLFVLVETKSNGVTMCSIVLNTYNLLVIIVLSHKTPDQMVNNVEPDLTTAALEKSYLGINCFQTLQGSYRQVSVKFKDFSRTSKRLSYSLSRTKIYGKYRFKC